MATHTTIRHASISTVLPWQVSRIGITLLWSLAAVGAANGADLGAGQLEDICRRIDADAQMSLAEKYEAKTQVLKASLEAGRAYTDAVEQLQRYTRIGAEAGAAIRPEVGEVLSHMSERVKAAGESAVFDAFGKVSAGEEYLAKAVQLTSDLDKIQNDTNLPPSAKRQLQVLRSAAEAVLLAGELGVPVPNGIDCYAEATKQLTDAVLKTAQNVNVHKDGGFWLTEEKEMLRGLPDGDYRRTPLFDQGIPLVQEVIREQGRERAYLQVEPGRWTEVTKRFDYDQVAHIVADYRCQYDGQNPSSAEIVKYLVEPGYRQKLAEDAYGHADYLVTRDLRKEIAPDMSHGEFCEARYRLRDQLSGMGLAIPTGSSAFRLILKERLADPNAYDEPLRRLALSRWPDGRDYLKFKGVESVDTVPLDRLSELLDEYRKGADRQQYVAWVAQGRPAITSSQGRWCPHCKKYHGGTADTHQAPPPPPPPDESRPEQPDEFEKTITHGGNRLNFHFKSGGH